MLELDAYTARADQAEKQIEILIKVRLRIKDTKTLIFLMFFGILLCSRCSTFLNLESFYIIIFRRIGRMLRAIAKNDYN